MVPVFAADPSPLYFNNATGTQQDEWDYLMKFKMFGAQGILFEGTEVKVTDTEGWFGTAAGNFQLKNGFHEVGGPIIIGGSILFTDGDGNEMFTTGPVRVTGSVSVANWNSPNSIKGPVCVAQSADSRFTVSVSGGSYVGSSYGNCPSSVPEVRSNLRIPTLSTSDRNTIPAYNPNTNKIDNSGMEYSISRDNAVQYIIVPDEEGMFDIRVQSIVLKNNSSLIIRMPEGGRLTRIFVKGQFSINAQSRIQIQYSDGNGGYTDVANDQYAGNLLFFVENDITWDARDNGIPLQGTYISTGQIYVKQQLTLAGQLLANNLKIDARFDGSGFRYVQFDPPILNLEPEVGTKLEFPENNTDAKIPIKLSDPPTLDVSFDYCFDIPASPVDGETAGEDDFNSQNEYTELRFPVCSKNQTSHVFIFAGELSPKEDEDNAWINVRLDNNVEGNEVVRMVVKNLNGAVMPGNKREGYFELIVVDSDKEPKSLSDTINVVEDVPYVLPNSKFYYESLFDTPEKGVSIASIPSKGALLYKGDTIESANKLIPLDSLVAGDLVYVSNPNEFSGANTAYSEFTFYVVDTKNILSKETYTITIYVTPVNDAPVVTPATIEVKELKHDVSGNVTVSDVDDADNSTFTFAFDENDANYEKVSALYTWDNANRTIVLKNGKTLNYESADSSLTIAIKVTDAASTTNGVGKQTTTSSVTIKIVDENEMPVVTQDPAFAVDENVANDLAGSISWADPDSENDLFRDNKIVIDSIKNASGEKVADDLFVINVPVEGVGNVSVNGSVNYESSSYYTLFVRIYDDDYSQKFPIVVNVNNQNENPEFACAPGEDCNGPFEIDENSAGPVYADLVVSDPDNDGLTGMTASLDDNGDTGADTLFDAVLDGNKVSITVIDAAKLDFEKINKTHEVVITVTDAGGLTASLVRTITVNDLNEPFEVEKSGEFKVAENDIPATAIGKIVVTDEDIKNETFRDNKFEIVSVKDAAGNTIENQKFFALEDPVASETGSEAGLKVVTKLNFEESESYVVTVRVFDKTVEPEYSKTIDITVGVDDQNEKPELNCFEGDENCDGPYIVAENTEPTTVIHTFSVNDVDANDAGKLVASVVDKATGRVSTLFDAEIGADGTLGVKVKSPLDYEQLDESYDVTIVVTDVEGASSTLDRTIIIKDLNEPFTLDREGSFVVAENAAPDTAIGTVVVHDEDSKNPDFRHNKFEIVSVKDSTGTSIANQNFFEIKEIGGEYSGKGGIYVVNPLDYEQSTKYSITVRVYDADNAAYTKTISFDITLNDVNENPEIIPDSDDNGEDDEIDKCKKNDNCVDDSDDPENPGDKNKIVVGIEENSATGTEILSYKVVDQDDGDVSELTATLTDVNKTGAESLFEAGVEPFGDDYKLVVRVKDEKKLDYEAVEESYDVVLTVADEDGLTDTIVRTIKVIDINEPFTLDKKGSFVVAENVAPDTAIGTILVLDEDTKNPDFRHNDYNIASVMDSAGRSIVNEYFEVDGIGEKYSGNVGLYVIKPLDYEKSSEYTIKVAVFDKSTTDFNDTITIKISLQDVNENPEIIPDSDDNGEDDEIDKCKKNDNCVDDSDNPENPGDKNKIVVGIEENSATGTEILSYKVVDQDDGDVDNLTATIEETDGSKVDSLFKVDVEKVGEDNYRVVVSVADSSKLDYEKIKHEYDVVITVADEDGLADTIVRTIKIIDVNENPIIAKQEFDFNENEPAGTEVGKIKSGDLDTAKVFKQNVYTAVAGDTALFNVSKDGVITTTKEFNYEAEPHSYVVVVKVSDKNEPKLFDLDTMVIALNNVPETPEFKNTEFDIEENVPDSTKIGTVVARDPDGRQELTYSLVEKSDYVIVTKSGDILVKDSSLFDYETIHEIKVKVRVTDPDKLHSDTTITIHVNDVNEAPIVKDQEFFVDENSKKNTVVGQVEASDLDTAKIFSTLTFELVGESNEFQVTKNGTIKTTKVFDYEADSLYTIKVLVTDGEFTDTAVVKIHVNDLYEKTQVEIIEADNRDSCWSKNGVNKCSVLRDTVYTNLPDMNITWTVNGEPQTPDAEKLHEGVNIIIKTYDDPTMNEPGADTLVVIYSTAAPIVTVSTKVDTVEAENIFTVVEQVDARDTNVYVNDPKKDIRVTVKDTVLGTTESFVVKLNLDTVGVSKKDFTKANDIVESGIALNIKPASEMTYTPMNGTEVKVSYTEKVNGETVTVSYLTDNDGEIKKTAVLTDEGTIDSIEVITVTYVTKVDGKDVSLSYKADAVTGEALLMSTDGGLMTASAAETFTGEGRWDDVGEDSPGSSSSKSGSKSDKGKSDKGKSSSSSKSDKGKSDGGKSDKGGSSSGSNSGKSKYTVAGLFSVTYDYEDESGNTVTVAYTADSKGSMVKNAEGNVGYNVSYSYTNPFGNTASQAVFIVIDQVGPVVEILSPVDEEVVYTNSVEVTWTVNGIVQDTLALQGLDKGANGIVRFYCDKAGNCDSSIVYVIMKNAKDVDISIEKPVTKITQDLVDEYYEANPPKKGETFAVSIKNAQTGDEVETLIGGDFGSKVGSEDTPYPGLKGHLGPTLGIDIKVPTYGGSGSGKAILSGLATFDELVGKDGMVNIDGVDAAKARKVTVEEFVKDYCSEEFADSLGTDYSRASLYKTTMYVNVWVYTSLGSFVDYFSFNQDLNDPDYADDAGLLKLYFEMKPDKQGYIRTESGKRFGTGSYVYKTEVEMRSTLQCTLPPVDKQGKDANKVGAKRKVTDNLLKSFGYRRPEKR